VYPGVYPGVDRGVAHGITSGQLAQRLPAVMAQHGLRPAALARVGRVQAARFQRANLVRR
jgi:hypothetical protein